MLICIKSELIGKDHAHTHTQVYLSENQFNEENVFFLSFYFNESLNDGEHVCLCWHTFPYLKIFRNQIKSGMKMKKKKKMYFVLICIYFFVSRIILLHF